MASTFSLDISRFVAKAKGNTDLVVRRICFQIFERVIKKNPVDTGRSRGNWMISINNYSVDAPYIGGSPRPASDDRSKEYKPNSGPATQASMERLAEAQKNIRAGQIIYLTNTLPYILRLEEGSSKQAPAGMVGTTLAEFPSVVRQSTASLP